MKRILYLLLIAIPSFSFAQKDPVKAITETILLNESKAQLEFIAADEMRGRDTGSPESDIAANYIAAHFASLGLKQVNGAKGYFQQVPFSKSVPVKDGVIKLSGQEYTFKNDFVVLNAVAKNIEAEFVYAGYGTDLELEQSNVKGKVVVLLSGYPGETAAMEMMNAANRKRNKAAALGALAIVETLSSQAFPWPVLSNYFSRSRMDLQAGADSGNITHIWIKQLPEATLNMLKETKGQTLSITIQGGSNTTVYGRNVIAIVEGTDPKLKNEYLLLSSHYDHIGVTYRGPDQDSIYNGARDNGIGTVAMMQAARYFSKYPPNRSVIFLAVTGEEKGLLGSRWYAENPLIDHQKVIFNFNCDGAGYNDVTAATIIGLERTTAEQSIIKGCEPFGLKAGKDPVPEQNLFDRSDNVNFAVRGIPAITFSPGLTNGFDAEIAKYYHQAADQTDTIDFDYLTKFYRAYTYSSQLIANMPQAPFWVAGDKYEAAGKKLYNK
jgi:hypothetical protein